MPLDEPFETVCNAPPYAIVKACRMVDLQNPEDVRWEQYPLFTDVFVKNCVCGGPLPELYSYLFTYADDSTMYYYMGQCPVCHTIHWKK